MNLCLIIPIISVVGLLSSYQVKHPALSMFTSHCPGDNNSLNTPINVLQLHYIIKNLTTIEYTEKRESAFAYEGQVSNIRDPYDIGCLNNVRAVLGRRPALWLWPQSMEGDAYSFSVGKKGMLDGLEGEEMEKLV